LEFNAISSKNSRKLDTHNSGQQNGTAYLSPLENFTYALKSKDATRQYSPYQTNFLYFKI
jgi:hypothetical protein